LLLVSINNTRCKDRRKLGKSRPQLLVSHQLARDYSTNGASDRRLKKSSKNCGEDSLLWLVDLANSIPSSIPAAHAVVYDGLYTLFTGGEGCPMGAASCHNVEGLVSPTNGTWIEDHYRWSSWSCNTCVIYNTATNGHADGSIFISSLEMFVVGWPNQMSH
jgi:hypothetical protein